MYTEYRVNSFHDYIECVTQIGTSAKIENTMPPVLWSRGHRKAEWNLLPTLIRDVDLDQRYGTYGYSSKRAVEEEIRKQNYIAKNYHFLSKEPASSLEWMEVMQHHGVKTRMLDWSESMLHSLVFALECFFNEKEYRTNERLQASPCVWILQPIEWNMKALELLIQNTGLIDECIDRLDGITFADKVVIKDRIQYLKKNLDDYMETKSAKHLKGIFNLSDIVGNIQAMDRSELRYHLTKGELYYCIFFLLFYVYMYSKPVDVGEVLPFLIIESYHSVRIQAQKGAFAIFPYYNETKMIKSAHNMNFYPDSMENMDIANNCLHKILLCDPDKIAFEVMNAGINISWLYPEMPVVANAIENRKIIL